MFILYYVLVVCALVDQLLLSLQSEKVFNQDMYFKKTVKFVGEPMTHLESIASSAVIFIFKLILFPAPNEVEKEKMIK